MCGAGGDPAPRRARGDGGGVTRFAVRGDLLLGAALVPGAVVVEDGRIIAMLRAPDDDTTELRTYQAAIVAPGFVDLQVNGGFGVEVGTDPDAIRFLAARLPQTGVTAWLPTVISSPPAFYPAALTAFTAARPDGIHTRGAVPLGLHLEGPFLSPARAGAHRRDVIEAAEWHLLDGWLAAAAPASAALVTLAPERPGVLAAIHRLRTRGVAVSLGHTDATVEQFAAGVDAGATMATHLYNAMSPLAHRAPGAVGGALTDDRVAVGLIADGVHVHPAAVRLAVRAKGPGRVALVTDMMSAAGMPPGTYPLGGRAVTADGTTARLADGTLAGSVLTMDAAVRNIVRWTDATPAEALQMASATPARLLGLADRGQIAVGARADLVLLDAALTVRATLVAGETVFLSR